MFESGQFESIFFFVSAPQLYYFSLFEFLLLKNLVFPLGLQRIETEVESFEAATAVG